MCTPEYFSDNEAVQSRGSGHNKQSLAPPPGHGSSTAEAAPSRVGRVGVGEHDEGVSDGEVHIIARSRENGSKLRLRKAEKCSRDGTKYIVHVFILQCVLMYQMLMLTTAAAHPEQLGQSSSHGQQQ